MAGVVGSELVSVSSWPIILKRCMDGNVWCHFAWEGVESPLSASLADWESDVVPRPGFDPELESELDSESNPESESGSEDSKSDVALVGELVIELLSSLSEEIRRRFGDEEDEPMRVGELELEEAMDLLLCSRGKTGGASLLTFLSAEEGNSSSESSSSIFRLLYLCMSIDQQ